MCATSSPLNISQHPLIVRLFAICSKLELNRDDLVIFGSGPLLVHGLRKSIRDLDVLARGTTWHKVARFGEPTTGAISGAPAAQFWGGRIQFSQRWISPNWDTDQLIDRADVLHDLRFARLTDVLTYKRELHRPKDIADIYALTHTLPQQTASYTKHSQPLDQLPHSQTKTFGQS